MGKLLEIAQIMIRTNDLPKKQELENKFIEVLTFSEANEIIAMLDEILATHWLEFPVWARNLSFRLACLLRPGDPEIRRRAAIDLRSFGPDWDTEAERLDQEANNS